MIAVVIMAAGKGTRMNSDLPKVLHRVGPKMLIEHVIDVAAQVGAVRTVVVVGHERGKVVSALSGKDLEFAVQDPPLGTGHAVMQAERLLHEFAGDLVVLSGDVPLLQASTLRRLVQEHGDAGAAVTVLTCDAPDPTGYGRIVRDGKGEFVAIVEHREATDEQKRLKEINSGIYCFNSGKLFSALREVKPNNSKGEYYLTDAVGILKRHGERVQAARIAEFREICGINTPDELAEAERYYFESIAKQERLDILGRNG